MLGNMIFGSSPVLSDGLIDLKAELEVPTQSEQEIDNLTLQF